MILRFLVSVYLLSFLFTSSATKAETGGLKVTSVRTYNNGNVHIFFDGTITSACGSSARVQQGSGYEGQANVIASALTALSSGRLVSVETEAGHLHQPDELNGFDLGDAGSG